MKKLYLAASAVFASIPGLMIIKSGVGTPPEQQLLFGGVIEAIGALTLLLLWINRNKIRRLRQRKITKWAAGFGVTFLILLSLYVTLFYACVVTVEGRGTAYYPLWTSGKISEMVRRAQSRRGAISHYGIQAVIDAIDEMPDAAIGITTVILLTVYQGVFTSLVLAFGMLGIYERGSLFEREPNVPPS
jgi:Mn2+/Fe2+ NRAMP family transporter